MVVAIMVSFTARVLNSFQGHIFCYSAISSSGVVLILPGFLVCKHQKFSFYPGKRLLLTLCGSTVQGSLELASKNYITGSTKIVYAIIYSLILGFCLTLGSDLAFLALPKFRVQRDAMSDDLASSFGLAGIFEPTNSTIMDSLNGTFTLTQDIDPNLPITKYHYIMQGCYRDPAWSTIFHPVPWEWLFLLAPLFVLCLACLNGQGLRGWRIWIMVAMGCCSFGCECHSVVGL